MLCSATQSHSHTRPASAEKTYRVICPINRVHLLAKLVSNLKLLSNGLPRVRIVVQGELASPQVSLHPLGHVLMAQSHALFGLLELRLELSRFGFLRIRVFIRSLTQCRNSTTRVSSCMHMFRTVKIAYLCCILIPFHLLAQSTVSLALDAVDLLQLLLVVKQQILHFCELSLPLLQLCAFIDIRSKSDTTSKALTTQNQMSRHPHGVPQSI